MVQFLRGGTILLAVCYFLCSLTAIALAQNPDSNVWTERPLNQISAHFWYQSSPLGRSEIQDISQDSIGYIWMASNEGLLRFDGDKAKVYDLGNTPVFKSESFNQVEQGPAGVLWISSKNHLYYYQNREFKLWTDATKKLRSGIEKLEFDNKGVLWVLANNWLYTIDSNSSILDRLSFGTVKSITKGADGSLWVVNTKSQVFQIWDYQKKVRTDIESLFENNILRVIENKSGVVYVALEGGELFKVHNGKKTKVRWNYSSAPIEIDGLMTDSNGFVWIEAEGNLNRVNDTQVETLYHYNGLADYRVRKVFEDRSGDIWVGTYSGISFLNQTAIGFIEYGARRDSANTRAILEDLEGNIWVGTDKKGLLRVDNHQIVEANTINSFPKSIYTLLERKNGSLLVGGPTGLFEATVNNQSVRIQKRIFEGNIRSAFETSTGEIWLNEILSNGEYRTSRLNGAELSVVNELGSRQVFFFYESEEAAIWIGTNAGLYKSAKKGLQQVGNELGLQNEEFNNYWSNRLGLWFNSRTIGLLNVKNDSLSIHNSRFGFSLKNVNSIVSDNVGGLWVWVNYGMYYISQNEFERQYQQKDSLRNVEFYPLNTSANYEGFPRSIKDKSGDIYITSNNGLIEIHPEHKPNRETILDIESYSVEKEVFPINSNKIILSGGQRNIVINYSAIDFFNNDNIEFEFKLEGFDEQWHEVGHRTSAIYTNLSAGTYNFVLRVRNRQYSTGSQTTIQIVKEPIWYRTVIFRFLMLVIGFLFLYLLYKLRTARIKSQNLDLQYQVELRTKELNEVLNSLEETVEERTEKLSNSNDQLNLAMEVGKHGAYFIDYDEQGNEKKSEFADNYFELLGLSRKGFDTSREARLQFVHPEDFEYVNKTSVDLINSRHDGSGKSAYKMEYRLRQSSGKYIWVESIGRVHLRHENGRVKKVVGLITDISDRKYAELELAGKEEKFRRVFDSSTNAMLLVDSACHIAMKNKAAINLFGYSEDDWSEVKTEFFLPEGLVKYCNDLDNIQEGTDFYSAESEGYSYITNKAGEKIPVQIGLSKVFAEGSHFILIVITDLSELVKVKGALAKSETLLKEERDKYESIFQNTIDALFIVKVMDDGSFRFVEFNHVLERIMGKLTSEVAGKSPEEVFPEDGESFNQGYAECRDSKEMQVGIRTITRDGVEKVFDLRKIPLIENGKVKFIYGIAREITEKVKLEKKVELYQAKIKADKEKYESAFQNINDALYILEVDGEKFKIVEFNKAQEEITGLKNDDVVGKYMHELFPELSDYLNWRFASCRDSGKIKTYQERLNFKGDNIDFDTSLVPLMEDGKVVRIIGIAHNITKQVQAQRAVKEREEKLRFAMEASQDAIIDWNIKTGEVDVSPAFYRMLGYTVNSMNEHILGIIKLINSSDFNINSEQALKEQVIFLGDRQFSKEFRMKTFKGGWLWVMMRGKIVKAETGEVFRFIGTLTDISTEKQKTRDKLEAVLQTEDNERSRISKEIHDGLQQTLTISALNLEFVGREKGLSEKGRKKYEQGWIYLQKAIEESRSVAHSLMPKAILDFGLVSACKSLIMEYNSTVENTQFNFADNLNESRIGDMKIEVTLYRILQEALNNIIKYSKATEVNVQLKDYSDILMLTIEDNGIGFDVKHLRETGKGFGIRSMQNRIDAISGVLEIESAPNRGTVVIVQISKEVITV